MPGKPRKARIDASGAVHHVIVRGIERRDIFLDDTDRDNWIARLGKILLETRTPCYAWAIMSNHVHLLLRTGAVCVMQRTGNWGSGRLRWPNGWAFRSLR